MFTSLANQNVMRVTFMASAQGFLCQSDSVRSAEGFPSLSEMSEDSGSCHDWQCSKISVHSEAGNGGLLVTIVPTGPRFDLAASGYFW